MCDNNEHDLCPVFVFYPAFHLSPLSFSCVMLLAAFSVLDHLSLPLLFFKGDTDKSYKRTLLQLTMCYYIALTVHLCQELQFTPLRFHIGPASSG
jgi:hypothetical protein